MKNNQSITTIYGGIMGTFLKVTQYGKPHKKVADKVSDYFQKIEHVCSRFLENSEMFRSLERNKIYGRGI